MEEWRQSAAGDESREVVETYRRPEPGEVVEVYVRPLPTPRRAAPPPDRRRGKKRRSRKGLWLFLLCLAVVTGLAGVSHWVNSWSGHGGSGDKGGGWDGFEYRYDEPWLPSTAESVTIPGFPTGQGAVMPLHMEHGEALTIQEVYQQVNPAVVTVMAQLEDGVSVGTGVIFTEDGYVLTNYHVVEGGSDCTVVLDTERTFAAMYVAGDRDRDLAVLKVDQTGLPTAQFGDSEGLTVGDTVYAIGNPLGVELRGTLTDGIVSAINRDVLVDGRIMTLIQTNAALNFGNSGGPLINVYGQVVGINTIKMSSSYSSIEGLGFAIPSASIEYLVNDLLTYGEIKPEPALGLTVGSLGVQLGDGTLGVEVFTVSEGTPAARAGIRPGDVLLTVDGESVTTSRELLRVRNRFLVGEELPITLWREGEILDLVLELDQEAG